MGQDQVGGISPGGTPSPPSLHIPMLGKIHEQQFPASILHTGQEKLNQHSALVEQELLIFNFTP
jgi:hypothetical protein